MSANIKMVGARTTGNHENLLGFYLKEWGAVTMFKEYPDVVTVEQLQKMLGIGRNTAYYMLKNNTIKSIRIGRVHKIPKINIIKYLQLKD